ncbi:MalY/PatB family protein [Fluviicola sp.]|uniref:MalY/PatB family protein n=1 Tax=Fluviicola sp. TaxID=1917219 RepID=UPI0031DC312C
MSFDFDEIIIRRNSNSYKWDTAEDEDVLPMWVADMDFRTAPTIIDALVKRAEHGVFGYTKVPQTYYDAVITWFEKRHGFLLDSKWLLYTTGVVPALSAVIRALTVPGNGVIVQDPVYNCFFSSIRNNGCRIISNNLIYADNTYSIDFLDLEEKAKDPDNKLLLLCSPHNPVGRLWTKEELTRIGEICLKYNVVVVSDEIHCDLVYEQTGRKHIPFASINESFLLNSVTCTAPSKTFNLAGLQVANILAADEKIRGAINQALNTNEVCEISPFAVEALIAAYNTGGEWLDELKKYLYGNYTYLKSFFEQHLPEFPVLPMEATYLAWVDCSALGLSSELIAKSLLERENLWINHGSIYGSTGINHFIRINIACPRFSLTEALTRMKQFFIDIKEGGIN